MFDDSFFLSKLNFFGPHIHIFLILASVFVALAFVAHMSH